MEIPRYPSAPPTAKAPALENPATKHAVAKHAVARVPAARIPAALWIALAAGVAWIPFAPLFALLLGAGAARVSVAPAWTGRSAQALITGSILVLGFGVDLSAVTALGSRGVLMTAGTLAVTLGLGCLLGRRLGIPRDLTWLVAAGTGVCGGSAIAALAPTLRARPQEVSAALAVVFCLNAAALVLFPAVGSSLRMDGTTFGTWCALAVHDTSSVVGAAATHGEEALEVATTTKLIRALWILPLGLSLAFSRRREGQAAPQHSMPIPWAFVGFLAAAALMAACPEWKPMGEQLAATARPGMKAALFFVGLGLSKSALGSVSLRLWGYAGLLWVVLATGTLALLTAF